MSEPLYVTTRWRRVGSIFLGALLGGALTAVPISLILGWKRTPGANPFDDYSLSFAICGITSLCGIALFAFPIWFVIEKHRERMSWKVAAVCGLIVAPSWFVIAMLLAQGAFEDGYTAAFWQGAMGLFLAIGMIVAAAVGCAVALAMWRFAYRRAITPAVADTFS